MAKPRAVEGVGDIYLIRPLGFALVQVLRRTPLTPTMVSFLAVAAGVWTAWLYYRSNLAGGVPALAAAAALVFLLHSALDSADGQLARVTDRTSELGRIVDGFCDSLSFLAIYVAIALSTVERTGEYHLVLAAMTAAAVLSHSLQSSLTEYARTLYLFAVHGKRDIVDSDPRRVASVAAREGGLFARLLHRLHLGYYRRQRSMLPTTARLESLVIGWLGRNPGRQKELAGVYRRIVGPSLPGWTLLASNVHKGGIVVAAFLPVGQGSFWRTLGMGWYLVFDLLLNVVMAALIVRQRGIDGRAVAAIKDLGEATA